MPDYIDLVIRFLLNISSILILLFVIYYPRYKQKDTAIAAALFNVFAFAVLSILSSVEFSLSAGFGLFAILALFTLRSEQISKSDISYFFGSVSLAVITSIAGTEFIFVFTMLALVLLTVYIIDHPKIFHTSNQMKVTLDFIPKQIAGNQEELAKDISNKLGVEIISVRVISVDYVSEIVQAEVGFKTV